MSVRDLYASKSNYLKAADMVGKRARVRISAAEVVQFQNGTAVDRKLALSFEGKEKKMTLNKTNALTLSDAFGDDHNGWIGKEIDIYTEKTKNDRGVIVDGLKVAPVIPLRDDPDDKIPF